MTRVKICGLTRLEDALAAVEAGADYLGFILYPPSPRAISPDEAARLVRELRATPGFARPDPPLLVGVFVNETGPAMAAALQQCDLDLAQLSGEEVPRLIGDPDSPVYGRAYKALRPTSIAEARADAEWYLAPERGTAAPRLLIDAYHPSLRGGTGRVGDWAMNAALAESVPGLMLAGGLTADNVAEAVRRVRPFAVDVAGGVEIEPGWKDHSKIRDFIGNVRAVDEELSK